MKEKEARQYKNVAVSVNCKDMLDELAEKVGINRGKFVENLVREAYTKLMNK